MREARMHLNFCITLYRDQLQRGKHFLHEHPTSASTWKEESVELIASHPQVDIVVGNMCQYGMNIEEQPGIIKPVKKNTRWVSSSNALLERLKARCPGDHEHANLLDGRAKKVVIYPERRCTEILKGMRDTMIQEQAQAEIEETNAEMSMINSLIIGDTYYEDSSRRTGYHQNQRRGILAHVNESQWGSVHKYFDEITHAELPADLVKAARAEYIEYFN